MRDIPHYSHEPIEEATPPTERVLEHLLEQNSGDGNLHFALGNVFFRRGEFDRAEKEYRLALESLPWNQKLRTNLGLTLSVLDRKNEAENILKEVILAEPLPYAYEELGKIAEEKNDRDEAIIIFERLLRIDPYSDVAGLKLGELLVSADPDRAERLLQEVLKRGLYRVEAELHLSSLYALRAETFARKGDFVSAARELRILSNDFIEGEHRSLLAYEAQKSIQALAQALRETVPLQPRDPYDEFLNVILSEGVGGRFFEEKEQLESSLVKWRDILKGEEDYLYARLKIAIVHAYMGNYLDAESELRQVADRLPSKKHEQFALNELLHYLSDKKFDQLRNGTSPQEGDSWEEWLQSGFQAPEAKKWFSQGLEAAESKIWKEAGFTPEISKIWKTRGFSAADAIEWKTIFEDDPGLSSMWRGAGFTDAKVAIEWKKYFQVPSEAIQWRDLGFSPDRAGELRSLGITDPFEAHASTRPVGEEGE
jgi:tetratricopeptide (TPR) repeat protein